MLSLLASANRHTGNQDISASLYEEAARAASGAGEVLSQARYYLSAIEVYIGIGDMGNAERLKSALNALEPPSPELEDYKMRAESELAESQKQNEVRIAALERRISLNPTDHDGRFDLAFLYEQVGDHEASLLHYTEIPVDKRGSSSWNNLGVARDRLKLEIRAIDAYRKAEELGNTLAMSNLAQSLTSAGFTKEAEAICNSALEMPDYDQRVPEALARIKSESKEQEEKEVEIVKRAAPRCRFMRDAGHCLTLSLPKTLAKQWSGPSCVLTLSVDETQVKLIGTYEVASNGLMQILGAINSTPSKYAVTYEGYVRGSVFFAKVSRQKIGEAKTSLLFSESKPDDAVMVFSEDGQTIKVMEGVGTAAKFYEIVAL